MSEEESLVEVPRIRWKNEVTTLSLSQYIYNIIGVCLSGHRRPPWG